MSANNAGAEFAVLLHGKASRSKGIWTTNAGVKKWAKTTLNRLLRREPVPSHLSPTATAQTPPAPIPHAVRYHGNVVASANWRTFADSAIPEFLESIESSFISFPDCQRYGYLDRVETNIKLNSELRKLAEAAIPYAYGEIQNALKRACK